MLIAMMRRPRSIFIPASLTALFIAFFACGGGGSGGDDSPAETVPTVVSSTPTTDIADQVPTSTSITVEFSEDMDQASVEGAIEVLENSYPVVPVFNWITARQVEIQLTLSENTHYQIAIDMGARDLEGTAMTTNYVFTFTTGDTPILSFNHPLAASTAVSAATTVSMTFSEPMDTSSVEDNLSVNAVGYMGTVAFTWTGSDTNLVLSFTPELPADTTVTVTVFTIALDAEGTPLGTNYALTFSTGPSIAAGAISGTVSDDPDSPYDDVIENTVVALFTENIFGEADTDYPPVRVVNADASGAYHFSFLEDETYWLIALQDSNRDGLLEELQMGDAIGAYPNPDTMDSVDVSGGTSSGVDFDLYDPEAISGELVYAGAWTGDIATLENELLLFAYTGDQMYSGEMYMTNDFEAMGTTGDAEVNYYDSDSMTWTYFLNPFFEPGLSVSGSYNDKSITSVSRDYIPAGDYNVMAVAPIYGERPAFGFAEEAASIADTGDDAMNVDIVLFDTLRIMGRVELIESMDVSSHYESALVSLLGWPFMEAPSSESTLGTGTFTYWAAPVGPMVAIHGEPGASEEADYLAYNSQYDILDPLDDNTDFIVPLVSKALADMFASLCGVTIDYNLATLGGNAYYDAGVSDEAIVGAEILLSTGNDVYYLSSDFSSCSTAGPTANILDGPQFFIFNVPIPAGSTATIAASDSAYPVSSVTIPLRSGEFTYVDLFYPD